MDVQSQTWVNNLLSVHMEFHAWIKQRLLKCWPDFVDALHIWKKKIYCEIFWKTHRLWAKVKRSYTWLDLHTNRACLFCCVVLNWQRSQAIRKWRRTRAKTLLYFSWICVFACSHFNVYAQTYVFILCVLKASEHRCNKGSWHSAVPFVRCHFIFLSAVAAARRKHAHRGTSVTRSRYNHRHFLFIGALLESPGYRSACTVKCTWWLLD